MNTPSHFETVLQSGRFAVTAEIAPPKSASAAVLKRAACALRAHVDALNITDNQAAVVRMSSIAACVHVQQEGVETVLHMTCRDRNRIGLQSDLLGAWSLGIRNVLLLTGDPPHVGNHPEAVPVFDVDSVALSRITDDMRRKSVLMNGDAMKNAPRFFIGVGDNPYAGALESRLARFKRKLEAGADFVQTQPIFDIRRFREWVGVLKDSGLLERVHLLAGILPVKSYGALCRISRIPGMAVPDELLERFRAVPEQLQPALGIEVASHTIEQLRQIKSLSGIHVMAINWYECVPELLECTGLRVADRVVATV